MNTKRRVFSGVQPTGQLHIGNYLGAIKQWITGLETSENIFCIVDLHAITVPHDPVKLRRQIREVAAILLASGLDQAKCSLFVQSHVAAHCELAWILNCVASMGQLSRMTQFKAKADAAKENARVGLFTYPTLMAADILLYRADAVPVGADQKQHVELTRDLAQQFNNTFGETFKIPAPAIPAVGARIMGLDDPTKKMSKSDPVWGHAVRMLDTPDDVVKKLKSAKTDSGSDILFDENRPGVNNLLTIYLGFRGGTRESVEAHFAGKGYGALKTEVAEAVNEGLRPIRERTNELLQDEGELDRILRIGADRVRGEAEATMTKVRSLVGLG
ncbi:tryptophan--tRNA ligase [Sorangium sp. So ce134]